MKEHENSSIYHRLTTEVEENLALLLLTLANYCYFYVIKFNLITMKWFLFSVFTLGFPITSFSHTHLFGFKYGLSSVYGYGSITSEVDYFTLDVSGTNPNNFSITPALFYELRFSQKKRFGINVDLHSFKQITSIWTYNNHPDIPFGYHVSSDLLNYRNIVLSLGPSLHLGRHVKISTGFDFQYNFRSRYMMYDRIPDGFEASPDYWYYKRTWDMRLSVVDTRMNPFIINTYLAAELRFWRLGFELRYGKSQNGNLFRSFEHNGYTHSPKYIMNDYACLSTKIYLTKIR